MGSETQIYKIAIFTSTRADYGILTPLIDEFTKQDWSNISLLITGTHLMNKFGLTQKTINKVGLEPVIVKIHSCEKDILDTTKLLTSSIEKFSNYFQTCNTDLLVILGDRFEAFGCATAAMLNGVPIAHIHGGELTEGAIDDALRHCITKMSSLHFPVTEKYRNRIIQLGEQPDKVFNVGALAVENILNVKLQNKMELTQTLGFDVSKDYFLITYHPETKSNLSIEYSISEFLKALESISENNFIITYPNMDPEHEIIIEKLEKFKQKHNERVYLTESLGMVNYLSCMKHSKLVLGNSSSGIIEAPILKVPTVNIGNRQKGREQTSSIINTGVDAASILEGVEKALKINNSDMEHPYGVGKTSSNIVRTVKKELPLLQSQKAFFDIGDIK